MDVYKLGCGEKWHRIRTRIRVFWGVLLSFLVWLMVTGAHLDLFQLIAWGRMFASNASTMPIAEAVAETFEAESMCQLCHAVADAKQENSQKSLPAEQKGSKAYLILLTAGDQVLIPRAGSFRILPDVRSGYLIWNPEPPNPPPRAGAFVSSSI